MTFKEAATILKADAGTHTGADVQKAIDTVRWYEDNQLELEDYETDQLHAVLYKVYKLEKLENRPQIQKNADIAFKYVGTLSKIMHTIQLHNDFINHIDSPEELREGKVWATYKYVYTALDNIYELNQLLNEDLDEVVCFLHDIAEELEGQANENV